MNYTIPTRKLEKRLSDPTETVKAFGVPVAKRLYQRLQEFAAADTLEDLRFLPAANCHELQGSQDGCLAVDVSANYRLIFRPVDPPPLKEDGGLDWSAVTEIIILEVIDYH